MTLEQEWMRQRGVGPPPASKRPTAFDRIARSVAWLVLVAFAGVTVWVATLVSGYAIFFVIGLLILVLVWMGGRLHEVNVQLREARERLDRLEAPPPPPAPAEPPRH